MVKSRRKFTEVPRRRPAGATHRTDLADVLAAAPVDTAEAARNGRRWAEDVAVQGTRKLPAPGACHPSTGVPQFGFVDSRVFFLDLHLHLHLLLLLHVLLLSILPLLLHLLLLYLLLL